MKTPHEKMVETMKKKYGDDYFSKLGSHTKNRPNRNNLAHMRRLGKLGAQKRWGTKNKKGIKDDNIQVLCELPSPIILINNIPQRQEVDNRPSSKKRYMHLYVIQPYPHKKYLYVNYEKESNHAKALQAFKRRHPQTSPVLRSDLAPSEKFTSSQLKEACTKLINELSDAGYMPIKGGPLLQRYWQTYVIYVNSPDSNIVYVGQSEYPRELRLVQHQIGLNSARVFKNNKNVAHSLAKSLMNDDRYFSKKTAIAAESELSNRLKGKGYKVYGGH